MFRKCLTTDPVLFIQRRAAVFGCEPGVRRWTRGDVWDTYRHILGRAGQHIYKQETHHRINVPSTRSFTVTSKRSQKTTDCQSNMSEVKGAVRVKFSS